MNEFFAALIGAVTGGLLSFFGQFFLTPRVERRVRAHERWEHDITELQRFVTEDLSVYREKARNLWRHYRVARDVVSTGHDEELKKRRQQLFESLVTWRDAVDGVRAQRLVRRAMPHGQALSLSTQPELEIHAAWLSYEVRGPFAYALGSFFTPDDPPDRAWDDEDEDFRSLTAAIDALVDAQLSPWRERAATAKMRSWAKRVNPRRIRRTRLARRGNSTSVDH